MAVLEMVVFNNLPEEDKKIIYKSLEKLLMGEPTIKEDMEKLSRAGKESLAESIINSMRDLKC